MQCNAMQGMSSVQCTAGQLVVALWVVVPRLTFANSCLAAVFYAVGMLMVCQNGHIGSRLKAMVVIPGAWTIGSVCAGITVTSSFHILILRCQLCIGTVCVGSEACSLLKAFRVVMGTAFATSCKLGIMEEGPKTILQAPSLSQSTVTSTVHITIFIYSRPVLQRFVSHGFKALNLYSMMSRDKCKDCGHQAHPALEFCHPPELASMSQAMPTTADYLHPNFFLQISIARQCTSAYITALCLLTALGMVFFSILRTKSDPGSGILTPLGYCLSILGGEFTWPARLMWRQVKAPPSFQPPAV